MTKITPKSIAKKILLAACLIASLGSSPSFATPGSRKPTVINDSFMCYNYCIMTGLRNDTCMKACG